ncbi:aromatic acid exporter family protein [Lacrimispora sp.]|uniref:aromatic acid exporter family protein n=1 Tax=Lacrimispora sp. TaxID=2719234 RepID=UPI0028A77B7F|nr:aromatic acid exporter family protein [Lacrimispora sp.]
MKHEKIIKSIKIALAAVLAITIAAELGLEYSATAGIITVLSIQNTKRETFKSAGNRTFAFLGALILSGIVFHLLGFTLPGFALYLLLFSLLCLYAGWGEAIAMDSVLITHFLSEKSMSLSLIGNETALFIIGTTVGVLVNMHLRKRGDEFKKLSDDVDIKAKAILNQMARLLLKEDKSGFDLSCINQLREKIDLARVCAFTNYNNALWKKDTYEIDYVEMRQQQSNVLEGIYENIRDISILPPQAEEVSNLLENIEQNYHRYNTGESLLEDLNRLLSDLKHHELPASREEFEARAILFYILKQLERLIMLKRSFVLSHER